MQLVSDTRLKIIELHKLSRIHLEFLRYGTIVIVIAEIKKLFTYLHILEKFLTQSERDRFNKFFYTHLQKKFTVTQGVLRWLCSQMLNIPEIQITFALSHHGKPSLEKNSKNIRFSMSHSDNYVAYAFTIDAEVGIDIEEYRHMDPLLEIAKLVLHDHELKKLTLLPQHLQRQLFFSLWTQKEAISKTIGKGLHLDFKTINLEKKKLLTKNKTALYNDIELFDISHPPYFFASLGLKK